MRHVHVSIAGVMGSGKTTVARILARELGYKLVAEEVESNPFLARFYTDSRRWVLASELFFLSSKIRNMLRVKKYLAKQSVVVDTPIQQDVYSYAKTQHDNGNMADDEWNLYQEIFALNESQLKVPDAVIYLQTTTQTAMQRINARNRPYEKGISKEDLLLLEKNNQAWLQKFKSRFSVLRIATDDKNFVDSKDDKTELVEKVKDFLKRV